MDSVADILKQCGVVTSPYTNSSTSRNNPVVANRVLLPKQATGNNMQTIRLIRDPKTGQQVGYVGGANDKPQVKQEEDFDLISNDSEDELKLVSKIGEPEGSDL